MNKGNQILHWCLCKVLISFALIRSENCYCMWIQVNDAIKANKIKWLLMVNNDPRVPKFIDWKQQEENAIKNESEITQHRAHLSPKLSSFHSLKGPIFIGRIISYWSLQLLATWRSYSLSLYCWGLLFLKCMDFL